MTPERLSIERCLQMATLLESHGELDLLGLAAILRQLFADEKSLVDTVNRNKIPLRFHVGVLTHPSLGFAPALASLEDGIDPETGRPGRPTAYLETRGEFLNHIVMSSGPETISIKDIIKWASNVAGGVHHDPNPRPEYRLLNRLSQDIGIGGLPAGVRMLKAVGRVATRSLQPLLEDVSKRA